jgi:medium-chain acyl-[acyl-carrier-protein] hydrolase
VSPLNHMPSIKYLVPLKTGELPFSRLFCFPFAGGSASFYRRWIKSFPSHFEIWGIQLPGREERFTEELNRDPVHLVKAITLELQSMQSCRFAFFGHSMGALLAFAVAHELRKSRQKMPTRIFISGRPAPNHDTRTGLSTALTNDSLLEKLMELGEVSKAALENPELVEILLPILRSDLFMLENLQTWDWRPLNIPLYVSGGRTDSLAGTKRQLDWSLYTTAGMEMDLYNGNHFYLIEHQDELTRKIMQRL